MIKSRVCRAGSSVIFAVLARDRVLPGNTGSLQIVVEVSFNECLMCRDFLNFRRDGLAAAW